ncbi:AraC-type DNA-binding domain-containing protein [Hahella chejuensis KCTC 2396]|uniref:AraC-type DNA-binding domain-containing protein n=1 Tax=Hahella chejuensis (strain KCTC 2396) TaxID=349521 RepID=Q2S7S2_HAHCH|nr:AraC family transcriptional regulator [Hahella chejuensis]ABC33302.1 AraC-type DNA-binding domain-containing protein [Hahella chejuensis KCTC 2396]
MTVSSPLKVLRLDIGADQSRDLHARSEGQLYWLEQGAIFCRSDRFHWLTAPRQLTWIPPGCQHDARPLSTVRGVLLHLREDLTFVLPKEPVALEPHRLLEATLLRLIELCPESDWLERHEHLLQVFLWEAREATPLRQRLPMPHDPRLLRMANSLWRAPESNPGLDALALEYGFSRRTLTRKFMQETGASLSQWTQHAKLLRALELLAANESVSSAAFGVGYQSVSTFCAVFKQVFGMSPGDYKRRFLNR